MSRQAVFPEPLAPVTRYNIHSSHMTAVEIKRASNDSNSPREGKLHSSIAGSSLVEKHVVPRSCAMGTSGFIPHPNQVSQFLRSLCPHGCSYLWFVRKQSMKRQRYGHEAKKIVSLALAPM